MRLLSSARVRLVQQVEQVGQEQGLLRDGVGPAVQVGAQPTGRVRAEHLSDGTRLRPRQGFPDGIKAVAEARPEVERQ